MNSCVLSVHRFIYGIEYGQEMRLKNLEHHRFCHNHYSNVREQGLGQPHCRKLHLFTPSFQVTGSFSPTALNRTKNSNVLRRMAPSQSLSDHFRYAPREHTTFLHPYTTNNACSIPRGGCHECYFTSVAESHFRVRIVLKKKIAKISVSLDGTLEDGLIWSQRGHVESVVNVDERDGSQFVSCPISLNCDAIYAHDVTKTTSTQIHSQGHDLANGYSCDFNDILRKADGCES